MTKSYKAIVTQYWWDFGRDVNEVIVESTHHKYKVVARFNVPKGSLDSRQQIEEAEKMIADLEAGRLTIKAASVKLYPPKKKVVHARNIRR